MAFTLPAVLTTEDDDLALEQLARYYRAPFGEPGYYVGAAFDTWDSSGTRDRDSDCFTADDLVAVTFLSVDVPARAAMPLLHSRKDHFTDLLRAVGPDRDLADEVAPITADDWPARVLQRELRSLPKVGPTIASKLLARKRPRLVPIYDSVVSRVTNTVDLQWEPMRVALRADDKALQTRLLRLRRKAGLPDAVSPLRVLDVLAWLEGKDRGL